MRTNELYSRDEQQDNAVIDEVTASCIKLENETKMAQRISEKRNLKKGINTCQTHELIINYN